MWRIELATNTMAAESRMGIHSDVRGTIRTSRANHASWRNSLVLLC
jgi:hypothetical protein